MHHGFPVPKFSTSPLIILGKVHTVSRTEMEMSVKLKIVQGEVIGERNEGIEGGIG